MQGPGYPSGSQPPDPTLPQPPDAQTQMLYAQAQNVPQGPTLGQANGDPSGLPPGNPVIDQYNQAISSTLAMMKQQGLMRDPVPPQPGPGILESLGTFGMANLKHIADENTRREENYKILQENRKNAMTGVGLATKMVDSQVAGGTANARLMLAMQGHNLALQKFINDLQRGQATDARNKVLDDLKLNAMDPPKDANQVDTYQTLGAHPSGKFRGKWTMDPTDTVDTAPAGGGGGSTSLVKNPQTGAWEPPKPGTPAANALAATGGGGGTGGAAAGDIPGQLGAREAQRKGAAAAAVQTAKTGPYAKLALNDLDQLEQAIKQSYPQGESPLSAKTVGGGERYWQSLRGTNPGLTRVETIRSRIEGYIRSMGGASRMPKELIDAMMSGMPSLTNNRERNLILVNQMRDSIKAASGQYPEDAAGTSRTDTATSGGGPPSSLGGTQPTAPTAPSGVTPGGIRFRVVQ